MTRSSLLSFLRGVVVMAALMLFVGGGAVLVDLARAGLPLARVWHLDVGDARNEINAMSRACNQLMAVVFTTVAIAVPLSANLYSLKFLEYFIKDRVNAAVLFLVVFSAL